MATGSARSARRAQEGGLPVLAGRVLFGLLTAALTIAVLFWNDLGKPWGPGVSTALAYLCFALHMVMVYRRVSPMDPLVWTAVSLLLFYFGEGVVIEWMGLPTEDGYDPWRGGNATYVDRGFAASLLAFVAFVWGMHVAGVAPLAEDPRRGPPQDTSLGPAALAFTLGSLAMVAMGIVIVGPSAVFGYYSDWWDAKLLGADQRWIDVGMIFATSGVYSLIAADQPRARWRRWLAFGVMPVLTVIAIQKGDRTGLIALGVGVGWCYTQRIARVRWTPVLAAAFVALIVMPVIGEWRAQRSLEDSKRSSAYELLGSSLYNMGSSVNALVYTLELIPSEKDYAYGTSFRSAILQAIPNLGLTKGKSWASGSLTDTPSTWITWIVNPIWASQGGGYGYSMSAEWYYNFGMVGLVLGMALTGWGMAKARNRARDSSLAMVWSATFFAGVSIWSRNIVGHPLKVATWPVVGIWAVYRLLKLMGGRAARRPAALGGSAPEALTP